jgi:hypothetical protein
MSAITVGLVAANVVVILANLYMLRLNRRTRAQIKRQLRAHQFAATESPRRYEGPA